MRHLFAALSKRATAEFNAISDIGEIVFLSLADLSNFLNEFGQNDLKPLDRFANRTFRVRLIPKTGQLTVSVERRPNDLDEPNDPRQARPWLQEKKTWRWTTDAIAKDDGTELDALDKRIRHVVIGDGFAYWAICTIHGWTRVPYCLLSPFLRRHGYAEDSISTLIGLAVENPWVEVALPFQPEYPGDRRWNRSKIQFRFKPSAGKYPTWLRILKHCGADFTPALQREEWARKASIRTGARYLFLWAAALFQDPSCKLPYLHFYGPENCGKTAFLKALSRLITCGLVAGDRALTSEFNGELVNALLVSIEERDLNHKQAYPRLKDLVTNDELWVRKMHHDLFKTPNLCHFVHTSNQLDSVPVTWGDSRVSMAFVAPLEKEIPPARLNEQLDREAPAFLLALLGTALPKQDHRLRLRALDNDTKRKLVTSRLPPFVVELVRYVHQNGQLLATANQLPELFGEQFDSETWPITLHYIKAEVEASAAYLRSQRVVIEYPPRAKAGRQFHAKLAA